MSPKKVIARDLLAPEFDLVMEPVRACALCGLEADFPAKLRARQKTRIKFEPVFTFSICPRCGLIFQNPRLTATSYDEYYREVYRPQTSGHVFPTDHQLETEMRRAFVILRTLQRWRVVPGRSLDYGSSTGMLMHTLKRRYGVAVRGVEINPNYGLHAMRNGLPSYVMIEQVDGVFDTIFCIHTLEHLLDPVGDLRKMWERTTKNGRLVLEVPNGLDTFTWNFAHNYLFTPWSVTKLLEIAGWHVVRRRLHPEPQGSLGFNNITLLAEKSEPKPWDGEREAALMFKLRLGRGFREGLRWMQKRWPLFNDWIAWHRPSDKRLRKVLDGSKAA